MSEGMLGTIAGVLAFALLYWRILLLHWRLQAIETRLKEQDDYDRSFKRLSAEYDTGYSRGTAPGIQGLGERKR